MKLQNIDKDKFFPQTEAETKPGEDLTSQVHETRTTTFDHITKAQKLPPRRRRTK
jgi:hypothetical protein